MVNNHLIKKTMQKFLPKIPNIKRCKTVKFIKWTYSRVQSRHRDTTLLIEKKNAEFLDIMLRPLNLM